MGSQGLHAGAAELLWRVYAARLKSQGPQHPETLATAHNLAVALFDQAQTPQALDDSAHWHICRVAPASGRGLAA